VLVGVVFDLVYLLFSFALNIALPEYITPAVAAIILARINNTPKTFNHLSPLTTAKSYSS